MNSLPLRLADNHGEVEPNGELFYLKLDREDLIVECAKGYARQKNLFSSMQPQNNCYEDVIPLEPPYDKLGTIVKYVCRVNIPKQYDLVANI